MSKKAYSSYTIVDIVDGLQWHGDLEAPPSNPKIGWAYYNTQTKQSYIYDGSEWVVFARDGDGISDDRDQYCQSDSYSTAPISGWVYDFPTKWNSEKPYVWHRVEQTWTNTDANGKYIKKYTSPKLISQYEVGTEMARKEGKSLGVWCTENNVSLIDGGSIATGTIDASKATIINIDAANINTGTLSADIISSGVETVISSTGITATNLKVKAANIDGTLIVKNTSGQILLEAGGNSVNIGDFTVGRNASTSYIKHLKNTYNDSNVGIYIGTDGIGLGQGKFYVTKHGELKSSHGWIGGWQISTSGIIKDHVGVLSGTDNNGLRFFAGKGYVKNGKKTGIMPSVVKGKLVLDNCSNMTVSTVYVTPYLSDELWLLPSTYYTCGEDSDGKPFIQFKDCEIAYKYDNNFIFNPTKTQLKYCIVCSYTSSVIEDSAFRVYEDGSMVASGWRTISSENIPPSPLYEQSEGAFYNQFISNKDISGGKLPSLDGKDQRYMYTTYLMGQGILVQIHRVYGGDMTDNYDYATDVGKMYITWPEILFKFGLSIT